MKKTIRFIIQRKEEEEKRPSYLLLLDEKLKRKTLKDAIIKILRIKEVFNDKQELWGIIEATQSSLLYFFSTQTLSQMLLEINKSDLKQRIEENLESSNKRRFYKKDISFVYKRNRIVSVAIKIFDGNSKVEVLEQSFYKKDITTFLERMFISEENLIILFKQKAESWSDEVIEEFMQNMR